MRISHSHTCKQVTLGGCAVPKTVLLEFQYCLPHLLHAQVHTVPPSRVCCSHKCTHGIPLLLTASFACTCAHSSPFKGVLFPQTYSRNSTVAYRIFCMHMCTQSPFKGVLFPQTYSRNSTVAYRIFCMHMCTQSPFKGVLFP